MKRPPYYLVLTIVLCCAAGTWISLQPFPGSAYTLNRVLRLNLFWAVVCSSCLAALAARVGSSLTRSPALRDLHASGAQRGLAVLLFHLWPLVVGLVLGYAGSLATVLALGALRPSTTGVPALAMATLAVVLLYVTGGFCLGTWLPGNRCVVLGGLTPYALYLVTVLHPSAGAARYSLAIEGAWAPWATANLTTLGLGSLVCLGTAAVMLLLTAWRLDHRGSPPRTVVLVAAAPALAAAGLIAVAPGSDVYARAAPGDAVCRAVQPAVTACVLASEPEALPVVVGSATTFVAANRSVLTQVPPRIVEGGVQIEGAGATWVLEPDVVAQGGAEVTSQLAAQAADWPSHCPIADLTSLDGQPWTAVVADLLRARSGIASPPPPVWYAQLSASKQEAWLGAAMTSLSSCQSPVLP